MPKLKVYEPYFDTEDWRASRIIEKFLLLRKAPVLETMHLTVGRNCSHVDMETWVSVAIACQS